MNALTDADLAAISAVVEDTVTKITNSDQTPFVVLVWTRDEVAMVSNLMYSEHVRTMLGAGIAQMKVQPEPQIISLSKN